MCAQLIAAQADQLRASFAVVASPLHLLCRHSKIPEMNSGELSRVSNSSHAAGGEFVTSVEKILSD